MTTPKTLRIPWKVILQEYRSEPTTYICLGSPTFKTLWKQPETFALICQCAQKWALKVGIPLENIRKPEDFDLVQTIMWGLPADAKLRFLHHCARVKYIKPTTP